MEENIVKLINLINEDVKNITFEINIILYIFIICYMIK